MIAARRVQKSGLRKKTKSEAVGLTTGESGAGSRGLMHRMPIVVRMTNAIVQPSMVAVYPNLFRQNAKTGVSAALTRPSIPLLRARSQSRERVSKGVVLT